MIEDTNADLTDEDLQYEKGKKELLERVSCKILPGLNLLWI
jgi:hypothetical protein